MQAPILIGGAWRTARARGTFQADEPATGQPLPELFPVSGWDDCDAALEAAGQAFNAAEQQAAVRADFLRRFAAAIERQAEEICQRAHLETALPLRPRLLDVELPRTVGQLRQAADAAEEGSWALPTIDTRANIRSLYLPLGPVAVFGPNNFPLAFNSIAGGDFAAAIAAGNPVIAKANTSHPGTSRLLAEAARHAGHEAGLPPGMVQMLYRISHDDGRRLVADRRLGATAYTGSRAAGLVLKAAADAVGKPIYLELSSINPVVILPGALAERAPEIADEFTASCLLGSGQFCTNPGLVVLVGRAQGEAFLELVAKRFEQAPAGTLLSRGVRQSLVESVAALVAAGAELLVGGCALDGPAFACANTLLSIEARAFLRQPARLQTEAFGNAALVVVAEGLDEAAAVLECLEGNLTGTFYTSSRGDDDALYARLEPRLRPRVGRLLGDKMPTGVAVSPAMNHGGPFPATGHPGFTAVGIPASLRRFAMLACYDNVRPQRLPDLVRDANPGGRAWRWIDGVATRADVAAPQA